MRIVKGYAVPEHCTHHAKWIEENGTLAHDFYIMGKLAPYIKPVDTVVDAGGHIGSHSIQYSNWVGPEGRVICFEPNPEAFECLHYNLSGLKNVRLHNLGLSDKEMTTGMANVPENIGANYLTGEGNIKCLPLDSFNLDRLDFMKIDVEGFEPALLDGAAKTIERYKPVMFIEVNRGALERQGYTAQDIYNKLITFGYEFRNITDGEGLNGEQFDIICTPKT